MIRQAAVAGAFYPSSKEEITFMVNSFLSAAREVHVKGRLQALVVPHAGYIYSGPVAAYGYKLLKGSSCKKFVLLGPSHHVGFYGAALDSSDFWETPLGKVKLLKAKDTIPLKVIPEAHKKEHSLEVQLPFLQLVVKDFEILPIVTGSVDPESLVDPILKLLDDKSILIVSSDLSHYYPYEIAVELDASANKVIPEVDIAAMQKVEACGQIGILILLHIAKKLGWKGKLLKYMNSGDTSGNKSGVVGYGCYAFYK